MATMLMAAAPTLEQEARMDEARRQLKAQLVASEPEEIEPLRVVTEAAQIIGLNPEDLKPAEDLLRKLEALHAPLTFSDIPRHDMEKLQAASSREQAVTLLVRCMGLGRNAASSGFHAEILCEYHYHNFAFCQQSRFVAEKASTFLSIMKVLHTRAIAADEKMSEKQARTFFEALVYRHARQAPPYQVGVFTKSEVDLLRAYVERAFFRHYKMYSSVYEHRQDLLVRVKDAHATPAAPPRAAFALADEINPREELARIETELEAALADGSDASRIRALHLEKMALQVGDLADLFRDSAAEAAKAAAAQAASDRASVQESPQMSEEQAATTSKKDDVAAAIDEAMQAHLGTLDSKFQLPDV